MNKNFDDFDTVIQSDEFAAAEYEDYMQFLDSLLSEEPLDEDPSSFY